MNIINSIDDMYFGNAPYEQNELERQAWEVMNYDTSNPTIIGENDIYVPIIIHRLKSIMTYDLEHELVDPQLEIYVQMSRELELLPRLPSLLAEIQKLCNGYDDATKFENKETIMNHVYLLYGLRNALLMIYRTEMVQVGEVGKKRPLEGGGSTARRVIKSRKFELGRIIQMQYEGNYTPVYDFNNIYRDYCLFVNVFSSHLERVFHGEYRMIYDAYITYLIDNYKPIVYVTHLPHIHAMNVFGKHGEEDEGYRSQKGVTKYITNPIKELQMKNKFKNIVIVTEDPYIFDFYSVPFQYTPGRVKKIFENWEKNRENYETHNKEHRYLYYINEIMEKLEETRQDHPCNINIIPISYIESFALKSHEIRNLRSQIEGITIRTLYTFFEYLETDLIDVFELLDQDDVLLRNDITNLVHANVEVNETNVWELFRDIFLQNPSFDHERVNQVFFNKPNDPFILSRLVELFHNMDRVFTQREYYTCMTIQTFINHVRGNLELRHCPEQLQRELGLKFPMSANWIISNLYEFYLVYGGAHQFHRWNNYLTKKKFDFQFLRAAHKDVGYTEDVEDTLQHEQVREEFVRHELEGMHVVPFPRLTRFIVDDEVTDYKILLEKSLLHFEKQPYVNHIMLHPNMREFYLKNFEFFDSSGSGTGKLKFEVHIYETDDKFEFKVLTTIPVLYDTNLNSRFFVFMRKSDYKPKEWEYFKVTIGGRINMDVTIS